MTPLTWTLVFAAAAVGSLHTMAPDHWMPFAAIARARRWSMARTARTTIACGFGHVTVSAALGIAGLFAGLGFIHAIGARLEHYATWLLMGFGLLYMMWGLRRSLLRDPHEVLHPRDHHHTQGHHDHDHGLTEWSLFLLFAADPCVAVVPMIIAASNDGWRAVAAVVLMYELATIATMVILTSGAYAGVSVLRASWLDRYGDVAAGAFIVVVGATVAVLGI